MPDEQEPGGQKRAKDFGNQTALAMELPFTLVGAVAFGGLLGFFAGVREVIRRLPAK